MKLHYEKKRREHITKGDTHYLVSKWKRRGRREIKGSILNFIIGKKKKMKDIYGHSVSRPPNIKVILEE